jgi:hypothetical protein
MKAIRASAARSTNGSPLMSTAARTIVPPVKRPGESPGRVARVVVGDRFRAVFPDVEALAGDGELARLRLGTALAYLFLACVQGEGALGRHRVAGAVEGGRDDHVPSGQQLGGLDGLLGLAGTTAWASAAPWYGSLV